MRRNGAVLDAACEDQRDALRRYRASGDPADAARVHYESCPDCLAAIETIAAARSPDAPAPAHVEGNRPWIVALYVGSRILPVAAVAALVFVGSSSLRHDDRTMTELERTEAQVRFARMPGRPDVCVAMLPGHRAYAPSPIGAEPCARVRGRVESDENAAWILRSYAVTRIRGTDACLARAPDGATAFTLPCGSDD